MVVRGLNLMIGVQSHENEMAKRPKVQILRINIRSINDYKFIFVTYYSYKHFESIMLILIITTSHDL